MKKFGWKGLFAGLLQGIFLLYTTVICVGPCIWVIISSFKTNKEILDSAFALPTSYAFDGYVRALDMSPIFHFFGNSVWISVINTIISVLVVAMAAYVLARFHFWGKKAFTLLLSSSLLVPVSALLMPIYLLMAQIGLLDTKASLILVYAALGLPTSLFILRGSFLSIPREIEEAAAIDGAGPVSYTHLDVYKRQPRGRSVRPAPPPSRWNSARARPDPRPCARGTRAAWTGAQEFPVTARPSARASRPRADSRTSPHDTSVRP